MLRKLTYRNGLVGLVCLAVIVFAVSTPVLRADPPKQWVSHGPGGGGAMYSPSFSPHNVDELYVACDMSPQFHTRDFGKTWETVSFHSIESNHFARVGFTKDPMVAWCLNYVAPGGANAVRPCRTVDGGKTWQLMGDDAWPVSRPAFVLFADYGNPDRAFVSAEYKELWVTLDAGKTWERKYATTSQNGLILGGVLCDGDTIYFGTSDGLLISTDGGKTVTKSDVGGMAAGEIINSMAGAKKDGKIRLVAVAYDGGKTWAGITGGDTGGYKGVYVLDVGQKQWVKKVAGIEETGVPFFVAMCPSDIDTAYLGGGSRYPKSGPVVYRTSDGGEKWESVFLTEGNKDIVTGWAGDGGDFRWSWPEYCLGLAVSPVDKERAAITDLGCVHATADGGKTWKALYTQSSKPHEMGQPVPKNDTYRGNGVEPTSVWGLTWLDQDTIMACYTDVKGLRSADGGKTWGWNYTGHNLNTMYYVVKHPTKDIAYLANSSVHDMYRSTYLADNRIDNGKGGVMYSEDKGVTWKTLKDFAHPVIWLAVDPKNPNRMYASVIHSKDGGIYMTEDLDKADKSAWTKLATPPRTEGHPLNIRVLDDGSLLASFAGRRVGNGFTESSGVFLSADGGKTWEDRSDPALKCWTLDVVVDPHDKTQNTWYACTFMAWGNTSAEVKRSGLYRTTDRGKTWTCIADKALSPIGVLNVSSCTVNPSNPNEMYFGTEYDGLFYTKNLRDAKPTFTPVDSYPFRNPLRIFFNPYKPAEVWVTSFGNGMYVGTPE